VTGSGAPHHLIVDAINVIGSRPTGWWRDRAGAVRTLVRRLQELAADQRCTITVVVDGRPMRGLSEGEHDGVRVLYAARGGPDAADDRIVDLLAGEDDASGFDVVTSDRRLRERVRALGAGVRSARWLLDALDALE
jgi:predicted RNA-binding protein with PIN domain